MSALEQLCLDLLCKKIDFFDASDSLKEIERTTNTHLSSLWAIVPIFSIVSWTCCILFFRSNWTEAFIGAFFGGTICTFIEKIKNLRGIVHIHWFLACFLVSFMATLVDSYLFNNTLCKQAIVFGGCCNFFPGLSVAMSLLEIYSGMVVYGTSKLIYSISQAAQIGFGIALGHALGSGKKDVDISFLEGCVNNDPVNPLWYILMQPVLASVIAIAMNPKFSHMLGILLTSAVSFISGYAMITIFKFPYEIRPLISGIFFTTFSRSFAWINGNERPLIYIINGNCFVHAQYISRTQSAHRHMIKIKF